MIILWWSKSFRSGSGSYYSDPNFFALDHIILWWSKFFCSGSWSYYGDTNLFSVDHIILWWYKSFFCGSYHTSGDPNLVGLDHDHFDFDDMIFLIQIQWSMIFCADPWSNPHISFISGKSCQLSINEWGRMGLANCLKLAHRFVLDQEIRTRVVCLLDILKTKPFLKFWDILFNFEKKLSTRDKDLKREHF